MEVRAIAKYVRVQPRKVRIIADQVRGKSAPYTVALLRYHPSKSAKALRKVLVSAMANAQENHGIGPDQLRIATIMVDEGPRLKRMQARAMGRGNRIIKKTSHITVVVEDVETQAAVKPHGTKAKPRPTFAVPGGKGRKKATPAATAATPEPEEATPVTTADAPEEGAGTPVETPEAVVDEVGAPESAGGGEPVAEGDAPETKGEEK